MINYSLSKAVNFLLLDGLVSNFSFTSLSSSFHVLITSPLVIDNEPL
jgi:hypothetical protein